MMSGGTGCMTCLISLPGFGKDIVRNKDTLLIIILVDSYFKGRTTETAGNVNDNGT